MALYRPSFQGVETIEFRKYIVENLPYPEEAKENNVSGKIFIKFIVRKNGEVEIPYITELLPSLKEDGAEMGEVVVVDYRPLNAYALAPDKNFVDLLKKEAVRVISYYFRSPVENDNL